jgi:uncharacterized cupredoxin-like copper-binding protein
MAQIEQDQITMIWTPKYSTAVHMGSTMRSCMVTWTEPDVDIKVHWACSCGDTSDGAREAIDEYFEVKGAKTGRMTSASSAFEYEDEQTFIRGRE